MRDAGGYAPCRSIVGAVRNRRKVRAFRIGVAVVVPVTLVGAFVAADHVSLRSLRHREPSTVVEVAGITLKATTSSVTSRLLAPTSSLESTSVPSSLSTVPSQFTGSPTGNGPSQSTSSVLATLLPSSAVTTLPGTSLTTTPLTTTPLLATSLPPLQGPPSPSSTVALPSWRLGVPRSFASGALVLKPLPIDVLPTRTKRQAQRAAVATAQQKFSIKVVAGIEPEVFFGQFDAAVGEWIGSVASDAVEARPVWVAYFQTIPAPIKPGASAVSTTPRRPTDFVVIIDDQTGEVLVASEFLP
jgi:hypothetical protein